MGRLMRVGTAMLLSIGGQLLGQTLCAAEQALSAGTDAYTIKDYNQSLEPYKQKRLDAYDAHTQDPPNLRQAAHDFLTAILAAGGSLRYQGETDREYRQGQELLKQGSLDPLVLAATALAAGDRLPEPELQEMVRKARERLAQSKYPARQRAEVIVRCHTALANQILRKTGQWQSDPQEPAAVLAAWLAEAGEGDVLRFVWRTVDDYLQNVNAGVQRPLIEIAHKTKGIHPWLLNMLEGHVTLFEGFRVGIPVAAKHELQRRAAPFLRKAYEIEPRFPEAACDLIMIARDGQDNTTPREWFDRAVAAQFDWPDAYNSYRSVHLPRNGGSIERLLEFGLECAATKRYDTTVPFQLSEILSLIEQTVTLGPDPTLWARPNVYRAMMEVCEGAAREEKFEGQPFGDERRQWVRASQVAIAVRAKAYGDAAEPLKLTTDAQLRRAFQMYSVTESPQEVAAKAAAVAKTPGTAIRDLELLLDAIHDQNSAFLALKSVEKLIHDGPDPSAKDFLETWRAALRIYIGFYDRKSEWVNVSFPPQLMRDGGGWSVEPDGALVCTAKRSLNWEALGRLKPPYELTCSITVEQFVPHSESAGIFIGMEDNPRFGTAGRGFGLAPKDGLALVTGGGVTRTGKLPKLPAGPVQLRIKLWPTYTEVYVNDVRTCATHLLDFEPTGRFALGVWSRYDENDMAPFKAGGRTQGKPSAANDKGADEGCRIRFQNLRIRRLELLVPPRNNPRAAIAYYTKLLEAQHDNPNYLLDRATAYADSGRPHAGLADIDQALKLLPNWNEARLRRAELLTQTGEYQAATDLLAELLKEDRNDWRAHDILAWLQSTCPEEKFRNARQALTGASDAWKLADSADKWSLSVSWAAAEAQLGLYDDGLKALDGAKDWIDIDPAPRHAKRIDQVQRALEARQPVRIEIVKEDPPAKEPGGGKTGSGQAPSRKKPAGPAPGAKVAAPPAKLEELRQLDHKEIVYSAVFTPDGRYIVSAGADKLAHVWDWKTGQHVRELKGHEDTVGAVAVSADSKRAVTGSFDRTMILWDLETGAAVRTFRDHQFPVLTVAISADGRRALSGSDGIRLWNLDSGEVMQRITGHSRTVWSVAFAPLLPGKSDEPSQPASQRPPVCLSGSWDATMRLWDLETGEEVRRFEGHRDRVKCVRFHKDGKHAVSGATGDNTVRAWDLDTGEVVREMTGHENGVLCVEFSPDGRRVLSGSGRMNQNGAPDATAKDCSIRLWDVKSGRQIAQSDAHSQYIQSVAFSPDGSTALSSSGDATLRLWRIPK